MLAHTAFLRASSDATEANVDIVVVADGRAPLVPHGEHLRALAQAMGTRWAESPTTERNALIEARQLVVEFRAAQRDIHALTVEFRSDQKDLRAASQRDATEIKAAAGKITIDEFNLLFREQ